MADNLTTQSATPATIDASKVIATREVTYSGDTAHIAPTGLVTFSGSDDGKTATDVTSSNPLPVTLANTGANATAVKVDGSAVTQPVSGTVTANAGMGTFAVSAASLPLPTGAATAAKQPALGTAGTPSADVLTVQGVTSMTALKVDGSGVTQPVSGTVTATLGTQYAEDSAHSTGAAGVFVLAVRQDSASTSLVDTNLDYAPFQVNNVGELRTVIPTSTTITSITGSITPGTGTSQLGKAEDTAHTNGDTGVFVLAIRTDTAAASSGTTGDYEALHTDSVGALWTRSTGELADDAAFSVATSRVSPVGFLADDTSSDSVDEGDVGAARMTLARKQIVVETADAASLSNVAASATSVTLQAANANRIGLIIQNDSTSILYAKFGATASSTSYTVQIPGGSYWEMPDPKYRGVVDGIWASATGNARVTELT